MSILKGISKQGSSVIAFLRAGVGADIPGSSILKALQEWDLGYRRTTFYKDIGILKGAVERWDTMKYVRREFPPSIRHYLTTKSPLKTNYQTVIELRCTHRETGEEVTRHVTVGHDILLKREELERTAETTVHDESPQWIIEAIMPIEGRVCPFKW